MSRRQGLQRGCSDVAIQRMPLLLRGEAGEYADIEQLTKRMPAEMCFIAAVTGIMDRQNCWVSAASGRVVLCLDMVLRFEARVWVALTECTTASVCVVRSSVLCALRVTTSSGAVTNSTRCWAIAV